MRRAGSAAGSAKIFAHRTRGHCALGGGLHERTLDAEGHERTLDSEGHERTLDCEGHERTLDAEGHAAIGRGA
jgi:hypothetical protein